MKRGARGPRRDGSDGRGARARAREAPRGRASSRPRAACGLANRIGYASPSRPTGATTSDYPEMLAAATPEGLRDLAKSVFDPRLAVIGRSLPRDEAAPTGGGGASSGAGAAARTTTPPGPGSSAAPRGSARARRASRGGRPRARGRRGGGGAAAPAAASAIERALALDPVREVLPNGLTVLALRRTAAPVLAARLSVRDGRLGEAVARPRRARGLAARGGHDGPQRGGASPPAIGAVGGTLAAGGSGVVGEDALEGRAARPRPARRGGDEAGVRRRRARARPRAAGSRRSRRSSTRPRASARRSSRELVYGPTHPLGRSALRHARVGRARSTREQVVAHHARFFVAEERDRSSSSPTSPPARRAAARARGRSAAGPAREKPALVAARDPRAEGERRAPLDRQGADERVPRPRRDPAHAPRLRRARGDGQRARHGRGLHRPPLEEHPRREGPRVHRVRQRDALGRRRARHVPRLRGHRARGRGASRSSEMRTEVRGILERPPTRRGARGREVGAARRPGLAASRPPPTSPACSTSASATASASTTRAATSRRSSA